MKSSAATASQPLLDQLASDFAHINFEPSDSFRWDPKSSTIYYSRSRAQQDFWSLFHEMGHMLLGHQNYQTDFELLKMEVLAWSKAKELAGKYGLQIDQEHIEKCLDSYRDWLHARSKCRRCDQAGLENRPGHYRCINCRFIWKVSPERFCRVYRQKIEPS